MHDFLKLFSLGEPREKYTRPEHIHQTCVFRALESATHEHTPRSAYDIRLVHYRRAWAAMDESQVLDDPAAEIARYGSLVQEDIRHVKSLLSHIIHTRSPMGAKLEAGKWTSMDESRMKRAIEAGDAVIALGLFGRSYGPRIHCSHLGLNGNRLIGLSDGNEQQYPLEKHMTVFCLENSGIILPRSSVRSLWK